jgi:beta-lactam-binding protein with PASTA domain
VLDVVLEQVGHHRREDREVEAVVVVREDVLGGAVRAGRVVALVVEVGDLEAEVRMARVATADTSPSPHG